MAFTLVELIAVIVVLAVLSAVAIPRFVNYSDDSRAASAAANLRLYSRACYAYKQEHGRWPSSASGDDPGAWFNAYVESGTFDFDMLSPSSVYYQTTADGSIPPMIGLYQLSTSVAVLQKIDQLVDNGNLDTGSFVGGEMGGPSMSWAEYYLQ